MVDYFKAPKLAKPDWLVQRLDQTHWTILTYYIDPGDAIEKAIDWVIEVFNDVGQAIESNALELAQRIEDVDIKYQGALQSTLTTLTDVFNKVATLEDRVDSWLFPPYTRLRDLVEAWTRLTAEMTIINSADIRELRNLIEAPEPPWWRPDQILLAITEGIGNIINPGGESEEDTKNLFQWLWLFFRDPPKFLYEMADEIIVRFF